MEPQDIHDVLLQSMMGARSPFLVQLASAELSAMRVRSSSGLPGAEAWRPVLYMQHKS